MSKKRMSFTVDEGVYEYLQDDKVNASGVVNRCLHEYISAGGDVKTLRDFRLKRTEDELEELQNRVEHKREKVEMLREQREKDDETDDGERKELLLKLRQVPSKPDHPLVQEVAEKLNMTPEEAIEASEDDL